MYQVFCRRRPEWPCNRSDPTRAAFAAVFLVFQNPTLRSGIRRVGRLDLSKSLSEVTKNGQETVIQPERPSPPCSAIMVCMKPNSESDPLPSLEGESATFAWTYAQESLRHWRQLIDGVDNKADALLRLSGGVASAAALFAQAKQLNWLLIAASALFTASAILCILLRAPMPQNQPTTLENVILDLRDSGFEAVRGRMAVGYWYVIQDLRRVQQRKASQLKLATWIFLAGVVLLIISALATLAA